MKNQNNKAFQHKKQPEDKKKDFAKKLFKVFFNEPLSRRMAATKIGYPDQTFMVTQFVFDWIE